MLKNIGLALLIWFGLSIALVVARELAAARGVLLGAVPTMVIAAPFLYGLTRVLRPRGKRNQMIERLQTLVDNPATPEGMRSQAADRLARLRGARP